MKRCIQKKTNIENHIFEIDNEKNKTTTKKNTFEWQSENIPTEFL